MSDDIQSIVIIGAGQAGGWCAKSLRKEGFEGKITLIGNESHPPYERPPLSKGVLAGKEEPGSCHLFNDATLESLKLNFLSNDPALQINRNDQLVQLQSGAVAPYDRLVLATGGRARPLVGVEGDRVHLLRTIEDSLRLKKALSESRRLLILGGGWIGLEVASTAAEQGIDVTVLEMQDRLCARSVPLILSDYLHDLHQRHGVNVRLGIQANDLQINVDGIRAKLAEDKWIEAEHLLVGIGLIPETNLAEKAGLPIENGIVVDVNWRTTDKNIFAIGDAANRQNENKTSSLRLESWANAMNSATAVAKFMMTGERGSDEIPWFWSDQHDVNIQIIGTPTTSPILRGKLEEDQCSIFFETNNLLTAAITLNQPQNMQIAKRLITRQKKVTREQLNDPDQNLKKLLK